MTGMQALILSTLAISPSACLSQLSTQQTTGDIELRIQAEDMGSGLPAGFSFRLINTTDHDILLPTPSIACEDPTMDGSIRLHDSRWVSRCTNDRPVEPLPIFERIKGWKTLHPGESMVLVASRKRLHDEENGPGTYEFWAYYIPIAIGASDRAALREQGIQIPQPMVVTSNHIVLTKDTP